MNKPESSSSAIALLHSRTAVAPITFTCATAFICTCATAFGCTCATAFTYKEKKGG